MTIKQLVEQIEGEASVYFDIKNDVVEFSTVAFAHFRGIENILEEKNALDALVITPRVCGICGHAHLMAAVRAIESAYENCGHKVALTKKAQDIREFTLIMEIIQNHFKWIYLVIMPQIAKLNNLNRAQTPLKGAFAASIAAKAIAVFAGQWPHSSYMIPGGVVCDPTFVDKIKAQNYLQELISFFEKESLGTDIEKFLSFESCKEFKTLHGDIANLESDLILSDLQLKGFAHDQFIVLGKHGFSNDARLNNGRRYKVDAKHAHTVNSFSPNEKTYAKNALYKGKYYETGPLSRLMLKKTPLIKNIHRRFKDSAYSRVIARVYELARLLKHASNLLSTLDITQDSFVKPVDIRKITASGIGVVEAPRGPLIHKVKIENGIIKKYEIITPTQWNIGSSTKNNLTPAQKGMMGRSKKEALFIFRTFDVCSVCTTH